MLNLDALAAAETRTQPYPYLVAWGAVTFEDAERIRADLPPPDQKTAPGAAPAPTGAFADLVHELQSPTLSRLLASKLGLELAGTTRQISVRRRLGRTDREAIAPPPSDLCTVFLYLGEASDEEQGGALRALNTASDLNDFAEEVAPIAGNLVAIAGDPAHHYTHTAAPSGLHMVRLTYRLPPDARPVVPAEPAADDEAQNGFFSRFNPFKRRQD